MVQIIPFKIEHAVEITENIDDFFGNVMNTYQNSKTSLTALYDGKVFCCGGVIIPWQGMGSVWTVNGPLTKKYPVAFHKLIKRWLKYFMGAYGLDRIQALVDPEKAEHKRWIEALGFEYEGMLKKYYGGKDFMMYAKIGGVE